MSTFKTEELKKLVSYAIKGAGFNKLLELSNNIGVKITDDTLLLNTTDGTNYVCVSASGFTGDIDVTVNADLFSKLISKITSDTVDITEKDNSLVIDGNGRYTLDIVPNENGDKLSFPDKFPTNAETIGKLEATDVVTIATAIKVSLSTIAGSVYSSYYFGSTIASTDRAMMSTFKREVFEKPYLVNKETIDLMSTSGSPVVVSTDGNMLVFETLLSDTVKIAVCSKIQTGIEEFNIDGINKFISMEVKSFCRIRKPYLLELLDRLSLSVSKFDDGAIKLHFTKTGLNISSLANNSIEYVEYEECKYAEDMEVKINIERLRNQLKAYNSDIVDLYYGGDMCIKLVDGDTTQLIALMR